MSIASEITRLTTLRNRLRTKLAALSLASASDSLADCVSAVEGVTGKAAQTYTPTTSAQSIAAGQYLTGAQTVAGDANLVPANIKSGVSIFGVQGTHEGGAVEPLSVTANGTYTAPSGTGYSPVTVNVGGTVSAPEKDVNFIDYDGTILHSYTAAEFAALTALPANPSHTGLTAQGWNWTLANAKTHVSSYGKLWIGQMYVTDDGKTRLYVSLREGRLAPYLGFAVNGTAVIDWGDGSATNTVTGTSLTTAVSTQHTYAAAGDYMISISVVSGSIALLGNSTRYSLLLQVSPTSDTNRNRVYTNGVRRIEIGANCAIGDYALYGGYYNVKSITFPNSITSVGKNAFMGFQAPVIVFPNSVTQIGTYLFSSSSFIKVVSLPHGITEIPNYCFNNCYNMQNIVIPNSVTAIGSNAYTGKNAVISVVIPSGVTSIAASAFSNLYGLTLLKFTASVPPTVSNSNAWSSLAADCVIYVPRESLATYMSATNYPSGSKYLYMPYDP